MDWNKTHTNTYTMHKAGHSRYLSTKLLSKQKMSQTPAKQTKRRRWKVRRARGNPHWPDTHLMRMKMNGTMGGTESGRQPTLTLHSPDEDGDEWLWYHGRCWEWQATHTDPPLTRWGWWWMVMVPWEVTESGRQPTLTLHSPDEDGDEWYHGRRREWQATHTDITLIRWGWRWMVMVPWEALRVGGNLHWPYTHQMRMKMNGTMGGDTTVDRTQVTSAQHTHGYSENSICSII